VETVQLEMAVGWGIHWQSLLRKAAELIQERFPHLNTFSVNLFDEVQPLVVN